MLMVLLTSQKPDPQQRPSRSPLSDMGLAKAWKKRDDKLNPSGKQCGNHGSGARGSCRHDPRCDAPPLHPPGLAPDHNHPVRVASSANRKWWGWRATFFAQSHRNTRRWLVSKTCIWQCPPAERKAPGSFDCRVEGIGSDNRAVCRAGMRKEKLRVPSWLGITKMSCSSPHPQFGPSISCPNSLCNKLHDQRD